MRRVIGYIVFALFFCSEGDAQNIFSTLKNPLKLAEEKYRKSDFIQAIPLYLKALEKDTSGFYIKNKIADSYRKLNRPLEAAEWYARVVTDTNASSEVKLYFAQALMACGKLEESRKWFLLYNSEIEGQDLGVRKLRGIEKRESFLEDSLNYFIEILPINSLSSDFGPVLYNNGLVFLSSRKYSFGLHKLSSRDNNAFFKMFYSSLSGENHFSKPVLFDNGLDYSLHSGPLVFYEDERKMIFTRNASSGIRTGKKESNRLVLYSAEKKEGKWINIQPLPINSLTYSVGHPAINQDGTELFFVSDMPGGYGGTDLYRCSFDGNTWSEPINLGDLNTAGDEMFPYFDHENDVLYFSSTGYEGLGGLDIYRVQRINDRWGEIENLGVPINSSLDDFGISLKEGGREGYFSSNRNGVDNIYLFKTISIPVQGIAESLPKKMPLQDAELRFYYKEKEVVHVKSDANGRFFVELSPGKKYKLKAFKENYTIIEQEILMPQSVPDVPQVMLLEFEKEHKSYVKGIVKGSGSEVMKNVLVYYHEKGSDIVDSLVTDAYGEFTCQIDLANEYLFLASKGSYYGIVSLKNSGGKKYSVLYYVNIEMDKHEWEPITVVVKDSAWAIPDAKVTVREEFSGKEFNVITDKDGKFSFNSATYETYEIFVDCGEKRAYMKLKGSDRRKKEILPLYLE
ncbi:MAG: hypothetical protein ACK4ND_02815 [Cytophagaceae bacterium]